MASRRLKSTKYKVLANFYPNNGNAKKCLTRGVDDKRTLNGSVKACLHLFMLC